jgi:hypothetical protein
MAGQSVRLKEEHLRKEEEKVKATIVNIGQMTNFHSIAS